MLESASICPGCRHHLRFSGGKQLAEESYTALSVDGTIAHRQAAEPCEYCIVLDITNERGEQVMRQVVGVGALQSGELRRLNLSVQMIPLVAQVQSRPQVATPTTATAGAAAARPTLGKPAPGLAAAAPPASPTATGTRGAHQLAQRGARRQHRSERQPAAPAPAPSSVSTSAPRTGAAAGTGSPAVGATVRPPAPSSGASQTQPPGFTHPTGGAPGQRLRIFRKP